MADARFQKLHDACVEVGIDVPPLLQLLYAGAAEDGALRDALTLVGLEPRVLVVDALDLSPGPRAWLRDRFVGFARMDRVKVVGLWRPPSAPRGRSLVAVVDRLGKRAFSVVEDGVAPFLNRRLELVVETPGDADHDAQRGVDRRDAVELVRQKLLARAGAADAAPAGEADLLAITVERPPSTEGAAYAQIKDAIAARDLGRARRLVDLLRLASRNDREGPRVSAMLFHEGMVADAEGDLEEAARLFRACRDLDEEIRPEGDVALAQVHRSLALVEQAAGRESSARDAFVRAATLYRERRDPLAVEAFLDAAILAFSAGDDLRAEQLASQAIDCSLKVRGPDAEHRVQRLYAYTFRARSFIERRRYQEALPDLIVGSRVRTDDSSSGRHARASNWVFLGGTSLVFGMKQQAAAAYDAALALSDDASVMAMAHEGLALLEERLDARDGFRLVYLDSVAKRAHVMNARRGMYISEWPAFAAVGDRVEIEALDHPALDVRITRTLP